MMPEKTYVFHFQDGDGDNKTLLGGKGAGLCKMAQMGLPVPPGFTISTDICSYFNNNNHSYPKELNNQVNKNILRLEDEMGAKFGDAKNPLLLSVRSGAAISMPGMMDTVLNLGLNDETVEGFISITGDARFAYDCYRRFVSMYGDVVLNVKAEGKDDIDPFEEILEKKKAEKGVTNDNELQGDALKELVAEFKKEIKDRLNIDFPEDPMEQLWGAIGAVFGSWDNERAIAYRKLNNIPDDMGTAVNIQSMVFGNMGNDCATGVAFTRNPANGKNFLYGEYLINAQGEDVVAGTRTPQPINKMQKTSDDQKTLEEAMPEAYKELEKIRNILEINYRDMQDMEFTIQKNKLFMLQTRSGKRTAFAALKIAVDMVDEGLIDSKEAILRIEPAQLNQFLRPTFDHIKKQEAINSGRLLAKGLNAGPGAATGQVVFNAPDAEEWATRVQSVILVRIETSPEDIKGMNAASGILTARGGMTSHAALVARQMGKVCVAGCGALEIDYKARQMKVGDTIIKEGDWITLDGNTGEVINGKIDTQPSQIIRVLIEGTLKPEDSPLYQDYSKLIKWANENRRLHIHTNADTPQQCLEAIKLGSEGVGLCRTEHMFFEGDRINSVREMILAHDIEGREKALAKLLPMQKEDFKGIFSVMDDKPVTIRTLDPPLHEFLPQNDKDIEIVASELGVSVDTIKTKISFLHETNPMLGHRGCRLGIVFPEITKMQARAIIEAACEIAREGKKVMPEIMIPLIGDINELKNQKAVIQDVAKEVMERLDISIDYKIGTMIEVPRGAITADHVAKEADFFSFGTNDLTQTVYGISRDDSGKFLEAYIDKSIWENDPFEKLDQEGVGFLIKTAVEKGRSIKPDLSVGICGEHGGEPSSVEFCHRIGLNYVSCSAFRIPIAILAAAQANLKG